MFTRLSAIERAQWNALEDTVNDSLSGVIWLDSFTYQFINFQFLIPDPLHKL